MKEHVYLVADRLNDALATANDLFVRRFTFAAEIELASGARLLFGKVSVLGGSKEFGLFFVRTDGQIHPVEDVSIQERCDAAEHFADLWSACVEIETVTQARIEQLVELLQAFILEKSVALKGE